MEGTRRVVWREYVLLVLALPAAFYVFLPTRNFYWDGVAFAITIEKDLPAASLIHTSHLGYVLGSSWLYRLASLLSVETRALFLMQTVNSILAGLCVILLYRYLRLRSLPVSLSVPAALLFGFSATWWRFAADVNAYVPSIFFLLCASILIERRSPALFAGLAHATAMLLHQLAVFFLPVAVMRLWSRPRSIASYMAAASCPVMVAYLTGFVATKNVLTLSGFLSWLTLHSPDSGFSFNPVTNAAFSIRGTFRLIFGGRLGSFVGDVVSQVVGVALVLATILFLWACWRSMKAGVILSRPPRDPIVWLGVYMVFLFCWMPQNTFYRLFYLAPLIVIVATTLRNTPRSAAAVWLFVPILFGWNFVFVAYPQSRPEFNVPFHFASAVHDKWAREHRSSITASIRICGPSATSTSRWPGLGSSDSTRRS